MESAFRHDSARQRFLRNRVTSGYGQSPALASRKQSILVVEDNVVNAALLRELLSSRGYPAVAVHNAAEAEAKIVARLRT